jgi:hypothetical protein
VGEKPGFWEWCDTYGEVCDRISQETGFSLAKYEYLGSFTNRNRVSPITVMFDVAIAFRVIWGFLIRDAVMLNH